jgi:hypothetical protein
MSYLIKGKIVQGTENGIPSNMLRWEIPSLHNLVLIEDILRASSFKICVKYPNRDTHFSL